MCVVNAVVVKARLLPAHLLGKGERFGSWAGPEPGSSFQRARDRQLAKIASSVSTGSCCRQKRNMRVDSRQAATFLAVRQAFHFYETAGTPTPVSPLECFDSPAIGPASVLSFTCSRSDSRPLTGVDAMIERNPKSVRAKSETPADAPAVARNRHQWWVWRQLAPGYGGIPCPCCCCSVVSSVRTRAGTRLPPNGTAVVVLMPLSHSAPLPMKSYSSFAVFFPCTYSSD